MERADPGGLLPPLGTRGPEGEREPWATFVDPAPDVPDADVDVQLLELARPALERGERVRADLPIRNTDRTVGTILGSELSRRHGPQGLPEDTVDLRFRGQIVLNPAAAPAQGQ